MTPVRLASGSVVARDVLLSLVAISVVGASTSIYSFAVGRWLGDEVLGYASLALAVGLGVAQVGVSGAGAGITRYVAWLRSAGAPNASGRALKGGIAGAIAVGMGLAALVAVTASAWAPAVGLPADLLPPTVALVALQSAYIASKAGLYGLGRVAEYARVEIAGGLAFAGCLAVVVRHGSHLLLPYIGANVVFLALVATTAAAARGPLGSRSAGRRASEGGRGHPEGGADFDGVGADPEATPFGRPMVRYATIATIGTAAALARLSLAPLVTGALWPAAEVGLLQAALSFLLLVMLVPRALELAIFPSLSAAHGRQDHDAFARQVESALAFSAVLLGLVGGTLLVWSDGAVALVYGPSFEAATAPMRWVVVAGWSLGLAVPAIAALSGADGVAVPNAAAVAGLIASLAVWATAVPDGGATATAFGLAVGSAVTAGVPILVAARRYRLDLSAPARSVGLSAVLVVAALAAAFASIVPAGLAAIGYASAFAWLQRGSLDRLLRVRG